jgi:hypothetical protein
MLDADFNHGGREGKKPDPAAFLLASAFHFLPAASLVHLFLAKLYSPAIILKF